MESWVLRFDCRMLLAVPTRTSYLQYNNPKLWPGA